MIVERDPREIEQSRLQAEIRLGKRVIGLRDLDHFFHGYGVNLIGKVALHHGVRVAPQTIHREVVLNHCIVNKAERMLMAGKPFEE